MMITIGMLAAIYSLKRQTADAVGFHNAEETVKNMIALSASKAYSGAAEENRVREVDMRRKRAEIEKYVRARRSPKPVARRIPAKLILSIPILDEDGNRLQTLPTFDATFFTLNADHETGTSATSCLAKTRPNGHLEVSGVTSRPGYVSLSLADSQKSDWSFVDATHAAIAVPVGLSSPPNRKPTEILIPRIRLRKESYRFKLLSCPPHLTVKYPDLGPGDNEEFSVSRKLLQTPGTALLFESSDGEVDRYLELSIEQLPGIDPYSLNRIDLSKQDWRLNRISGLHSPLMFQGIPHRLEELLSVPTFERRTETNLPKTDRNRTGKVGEVVHFFVLGKPIELTVRTVLNPQSEDKKLAVIEQVAYTDATAGDAGGITVTSKVGDLVGRFGKPETIQDNTYCYLGGGLKFQIWNGKVRKILFCHPMEFVRDGLSPAPPVSTVAVRIEDDHKITDCSISVSDPGFEDQMKRLLEAKRDGIAKAFGNAVLSMVGGANVGLRQASGDAKPNLVLLLRDPQMNLKNISEPHQYSFTCTEEITDLRSQRVLIRRPLERSQQYRDETELESIRTDLLQQAVELTLDFLKHNSVVGRVTRIDDQFNVHIQVEHPELFHAGDKFRLRNFDVEALPQKFLAVATQDPDGSEISCEIEACELLQDPGEYRITKLRDALKNQLSKYLLDPGTGLVFADEEWSAAGYHPRLRGKSRPTGVSY